MLALYRKSESYLKNSREMLGDVGMEKNSRARIEHFRGVLSTLPQSVDDSDDIMQALREQAGAQAFTRILPISRNFSHEFWLVNFARLRCRLQNVGASLQYEILIVA